MPKLTRDYAPIWAALKIHRSVELHVPAKLHKRVKKAIIAEKYLDNLWKEKNWRREVLQFDLFPESNTIKVRLVPYMQDIVATDL